MHGAPEQPWPASSGEMAALIRKFEWGRSPLGPLDRWPQSLRSAVELILPCGFPMIVLWGPELIQIYNDEYRLLMGRKHPGGLGQRTKDCWPEVWHINQPIYDRVWGGETVTFEDALYPLRRSGELEDIWLTLTYSPLRDDGGRIAGVLVTIFETTARKIAEQGRDRFQARVKVSEARQAYLLKLADALRRLGDPVEVQLVAARHLGQHLGASRVAYAEDYGDGERVVLARNYTDGVPGIEGTYRYADYGEELTREMRAGRAVVRPDIANDPTLSAAEKQAHVVLQLGATLNVPLVKTGRLVAIFAVHYASAHAFTDEEIDLVRETAERTWAAVERARAEAALRENEERFRQFSESSTDMLWIRDAESLQFEYVSPAVEQIYALSAKSVLAGDSHENWPDFIVAEDRKKALEAMDKARQGEKSSSEYRIERPEGSVRWIRSAVFPLRNTEGRVARLGGIDQDITDEKEAAQRLQVMVEELKHRTRNLLGVVQGIAHQTMRSSKDLQEFEGAFSDRLHALGQVQDLLSKADDADVPMTAVVGAELDALAAGDLKYRITSEGPDLRLQNSAVQMFSLALHELATNARKYGALAQSGGRLSVRWSIRKLDQEEPRLEFEWRETGLDIVPGEPTARGYGRYLIERALPLALGGETSYAFTPDGLRCEFSFPLYKVVKNASI